MLLSLLVAQIGAAPHSSPIVHPETSILPRVSEAKEASTTEPGYAPDVSSITSRILPRDFRTFDICGVDIDAPPYNPWSPGEQNYFPYFSYTYRFQDQQGTRRWDWHLQVGPTGFVGENYASEHIYELQLIKWFFNDYLVESTEVVNASPKGADYPTRYKWFCKYHIKPKIINSKDWTYARTFYPYRTPVGKLSAQLSGTPRSSEMVYLAADLNSIKGIFFGLNMPRDHNHLPDILADLAKVSLLAQYLNHETVWNIFGRVSKRMDKFYGVDVQGAVTRSEWNLGKKIPWGGCYDNFESRFLMGVQRKMRRYRDHQIRRAILEIGKQEASAGASLKWLRDMLQEYRGAKGPLSDEVFSLEKLLNARENSK
jgi:hypothetical protein